jgi:hypothetical protein
MDAIKIIAIQDRWIEAGKQKGFGAEAAKPLEPFSAKD